MANVMLDAILDEGVVCHLGYLRDTADGVVPVVIPTLYARDGDDAFVDPQTINPPYRECMTDPADKCGADNFYNNEAVLMDALDMHNADYSQAHSYTWNVELPSVECDNCTLQVIQVMEDIYPIHAPYTPGAEDNTVIDRSCRVVIPEGTVIRDERERPPVDLDLRAVLLLDLLEPHRGVEAPGSEIVREDVESDHLARGPVTPPARRGPRTDR